MENEAQAEQRAYELDEIFAKKVCPTCERSALHCMHITPDLNEPELHWVKNNPGNICSGCDGFQDSIQQEAPDTIPQGYRFPDNDLQAIIRMAPVAKHALFSEATEEQIYEACEMYKRNNPNQPPIILTQQIQRPKNAKIPLPETKEEKALMRLIVRMTPDVSKDIPDPDAPSPTSIRRGRFMNRAQQYDAFYKQPYKSAMIKQAYEILIKKGLIVEYPLTDFTKVGRQAHWITSPYVDPVHPDLFEALRLHE